jgi:hypothetical protein
MRAKTITFLVTCIDAPSVLVSFEPEGAQHLLEGDATFRVEMVGSTAGEPEISYAPDGLIIGAWAGAATRVWNQNGDELAT